MTRWIFYPFYLFEIVEPNNKFWPFLLETSVGKAMQSPQSATTLRLLTLGFSD